MKVILINGSPHQYGSTNRALEEVKNELIKEKIDASILWIGTQVFGCTACNSCYESKKCIYDDSVNEIGELLESIDGIVFGSPVYYASASGSMTSFLDRLFRSYSKKLEYKPGACISVARRAGTLSTFDQLNKYLAINSMPIVTSQYWNGVHGNNPLELEKDLEGLQTMRTLAKNMAWSLKSIDAGKKAGIKSPEQETRERTNFIR